MPFPLALRPSADDYGTESSLKVLVDRIYKERGHMRNITEQSLREEIEEKDAAVASESESSDSDDRDAGEDAEAKMKTLVAAKEEMVGLIGEANNEVLMMLDFMSLLVSKDAKHAAETMSPALRQMTEAGTFAFDRNPIEDLDEATSSQANSQADGLKLQSLQATADRLLSSAASLEKEMTRETQYWEQVLSITEKGWNITRIRGSAHALGIRYACCEAAPHFQAKGQASLRPSESGDLTFVTGAIQEPKCLRVRIVEAGNVIGSSRLPALLEREDKTLEDMVHQARDSLFDEELFWELSREARDLLAYGVRIKSDVICVPLWDNDEADAPHNTDSREELLIDLVDRESSASADGVTVEAVACYLRLGLNHIYRERYQRRTRPPAPLSMKKTEDQACSLLTAIIAITQHRRVTKSVQQPLAALTCSVGTALDMTCQMIDQREPKLSSSRSGKQPASNSNRPSGMTPTEEVFASSLGPQSTTFTIGFPNSASLAVNVTTSLSAPQYGTSYSIDLSVSSAVLEGSHGNFTDSTDLLVVVDNLFRESVMQHLADRCPSWILKKHEMQVTSKVDGRKRLTVQISNGKLVVVTAVEGTDVKSNIIAAWDGKIMKKVKSVEASNLIDIVEEAAR